VDYPFSLRFGRNQLAIGQPFELRSNETAPRRGTPETREDERWDQNATFIASARADIPRLLSEVRRLRSATAGG